MNYCSPEVKYKKCLNKNDLDIIIEIYNKIFINDKIIKTKNKYNDINNKLKLKLGNNNYHLWIDYLLEYVIDINDKEKIKNISDNRFIPKKPLNWYLNPNTWVSNYDIDKVLNQYEKTKKYKYKYIGCFTIDFALKDNKGKCMYYEDKCDINIEKIIKNGKKYMGLITNLDTYDQSGSHWTSTFMILDPKLESYGIYYYDSAGSTIPELIMIYINNVKNQLKKIYKKEPIIFTNKKKFQKGSSECGMFALTFQIKWLNKILKNKKTKIEEILDDEMTDINVFKKRNEYFRPKLIKNNIK
jgi:hypothetical protein